MGNNQIAFDKQYYSLAPLTLIGMNRINALKLISAQVCIFFVLREMHPIAGNLRNGRLCKFDCAYCYKWVPNSVQERS